MFYLAVCDQPITDTVDAELLSDLSIILRQDWAKLIRDLICAYRFIDPPDAPVEQYRSTL